MAADENTPEQESQKSVEEQVSSLLGYLQTPIKHVQDWVSSGQLQSTIETLQERAERTQVGVERGLRALNEVRQGVQIHVKKQIEGYQREKAERAELTDSGTAEKSPAAKTKGSGSRKKASEKKGSGRKR